MKKQLLSTIIVLLGVVLSYPCIAQIPKTIAYQGVLTNTSGTPVADSTYTTTFRLFNPESTVIWQETKTVQTSRGLFSVSLGSTVAFPDSLKFDRPYRLGIQLSNEPQLLPLIPLNSVGYSQSAVRSDTAGFVARVSNADSVNGISASSQQLPNSLYPLDSTGGITLVSNPGAYKSFSAKHINDLPSLPDAFLKMFKGGVYCALQLTPAPCAAAQYGINIDENLHFSVGNRSPGDKYGVEAVSATGTALYAHNTSNSSPIPSGYFAGYFAGPVQIEGDLTLNGTIGGTWSAPVSGDLYGSYPTPSVVKIQGTPIASPLSPTTGEVLKWDGTQWAPGTISGAGIGGSGTSNYVPKFSGSTSLSNSQLYDDGTNIGLGTTSPTARFHVSNNTSANGIIGETSTGWGVRGYSNSSGYGVSGYSSSAYGGYFETGNSSQWALVAKSNAGSSSAEAFYATGSARIDGSLSVGGTITGSYSGSAGGDLSGSYPNPTVVRIQGRNVSTTAPSSDGQVLTWNSSSQWWEPRTGGGSGGISGSGSSNYVPKFSGSTSIGNSQLYDNGTYVGIGTTSPSARLDVANSSAPWSILGETSTGHGVRGYSNSSGYGVSGYSSSAYGGYFETGTSNQFGLVAKSNGGQSSAYAFYATGYARIDGNLSIGGTISKGGGSFKIDHPLDPENKYLYHSFVESPDMKNIYDGIVVTNANGEATVSLPDWFDTLNRDFRYQLTVIGTFSQAIVKNEITDNQFTIKTDKPSVKVSWQVTGIRKDPFANAHRIPVEELKEKEARGKYLYPKEYGMPETMGIGYSKSSAEGQNNSHER